jgi:hemerythrin
MAIEWTSELSVGIPELDLQHQQLYGLAGRLHDAMRAGDRAAVPDIVVRLHELAEAHFACEERWMADLRYPGLRDHRVAHASFTADLACIERALAGGIRPSAMVDLAHFLGRWMREHLRGADLPFGRWAVLQPCFARRAARPESARASTASALAIRVRCFTASK